MRPYAIGLDIGITSVGWAALALDEKELPCGIIGMGSRIFDAAEQPKTGESLAAPRREARSNRRRLRRHRHRNERIRALLLTHTVLSDDKLSRLFEGELDDIYQLRVDALDRNVTNEELARILIHISQRRGFKSNRKKVSTKEDGAILEAVNENKRRMEEKGYRTVAEMLLLDETFSDHKRNKGGNYITTVTRDMVADETKAIFQAQRELGNDVASTALEEDYFEILLGQRSFDEGPGGNSPYTGNQIERMIGHCTFFPEELRAAKATYSFEYFTLLEKINNIRLISNGVSVELTPAQRQNLIELAHETADLNYAKIRKVIGVLPEQRFNILHYSSEQSTNETEKKEKLNCLRAYHEMRKAFEKVSKGSFALFPTSKRNAIGTVLTIYKTSGKIREKLAEAGLNENEIDIAESIGSFSKFGHLSVKACDMLIPFLEQGKKYNEACEMVGIDFKSHISSQREYLLHPTEADYADITSPVVKRAVSQTIKVLNAIIREQGCSPTFINIELAREMAKDFRERKQIEKENNDNRAKNEKLLDRIKSEYGISNPTGLDLVKMKLYEEQQGVCAYSLRQISFEKLFEPNYAEIDHIIPYSISFDDSYKNKVLVLAEENRNKGNRLPMQYLTGQRRDDFVVWVNSSVRNYRKKQNLLKECISEEDKNKFIERNLQDTKTMSRFLYNYINDNLEFAESGCGRKKKVTAVSGSVTSYMRKRWGITKIREDGDLHHAVDAVVIACTTDRLIQQVSRYSAYRESRYILTDFSSIAVDPTTGEVVQQFPYPWPQFRKELEARLCNNPARAIYDLKLPFYMSSGEPLPKPLFVSRMPKHKVTGAAHKDTIKSPKLLDEGHTVVRRALKDLKLKDGEIENYYMPQSDTLLYNALKEQLIRFNGDAKKAFAEPFHKPKNDGTPGPIVNKVKLCEPTTLNVSVHGGKGVADNDSMVRVDVFKVEGDGYYFVPIYIADTLKPQLPNRACVAFKASSEWKEMKDSNYLFSLYPNDLIKVTHKNVLKLSRVLKGGSLPASCEKKSELMYFKCANIASAVFSCINHDNTYEVKSLGIKTLECLEKYTVDVLGNFHKVEKEVRQAFCQQKD